MIIVGFVFSYKTALQSYKFGGFIFCRKNDNALIRADIDFLLSGF